MRLAYTHKRPFGKDPLGQSLNYQPCFLLVRFLKAKSMKSNIMLLIFLLVS